MVILHNTSFKLPFCYTSLSSTLLPNDEKTIFRSKYYVETSKILFSNEWSNFNEILL